MTDLKEYLEPCKKLAIVAFGPKATCEINKDLQLEFKLGKQAYIGWIGRESENEWYVNGSSYDPGNREQPPDWNDIDLGTFKRFDQAFLRFALEYAKKILSNAIEMVFQEKEN